MAHLIDLRLPHTAVISGPVNSEWRPFTYVQFM